jgi:hypothetical protein
LTWVIQYEMYDGHQEAVLCSSLKACYLWLVKQGSIRLKGDTYKGHVGWDTKTEEIEVRTYGDFKSLQRKRKGYYPTLMISHSDMGKAGEMAFYDSITVRRQPVLRTTDTGWTPRQIDLLKYLGGEQ